MTLPRFRFSLRTMPVVVAALGCWLGYSLNWIRGRHKVTDQAGEQGIMMGGDSVQDQMPAPALLWVLGEPGYYWIATPYHEGSEKIVILRRLFPEAHVAPPVKTGRD